jgi:hypothetical protein
MFGRMGQLFNVKLPGPHPIPLGVVCITCRNDNSRIAGELRKQRAQQQIMRKNVDSKSCLESVLGAVIACRELRAGIQASPSISSSPSFSMMACANSRTLARRVRSRGIVSTLPGLLRRAPMIRRVFGTWVMASAAAMAEGRIRWLDFRLPDCAHTTSARPAGNES